MCVCVEGYVCVCVRQVEDPWARDALIHTRSCHAEPSAFVFDFAERSDN